jgi:hypothetical protein
VGFSALVVVGCQDIGACGSYPIRLNFDHIEQADRVRVLWSGNIPIADIRDPRTVEAARTFVERHREGWREAWTGPRTGERHLHFYRGESQQR